MANYFNNEKYPDPTAHGAIHTVELEEKKREKIKDGRWNMKRIYIASPYRGNTGLNTKRAKRYARFVAMQDMVPIAPHIYATTFLDDAISTEREIGICLGLQLMKVCHELWIFGSEISEGMSREIQFAKKLNIRIKYFDLDCKEVKHYGI